MADPQLARLHDPSDPGASLARLQRFVDALFCEPATVGRLFGDATLDAACQAIGRDRLRALGLQPPAQAAGPVVYIASKLQASGGHSAALADTIRLGPRRPSVVLLTDTCGRTDRAEVAQRLAGLPDVQVAYVPPGGHLAKLDWLLRELHRLAPSDVWLFNHHQDSVAVAAVQPGQGYRLHYYHHGDDRLCLGVRLDWGTHHDPLPFCAHNCREQVGVRGNRYLPLAVSDLGMRPPGGWMRDGRLTTCTAAGFNKVEVDYVLQYVDVVPRLLAATGGRHLHIGQLTPVALRNIHTHLRRLGVAQDAFTYIPRVPSVWRTLHEHGVDLYLASFPYGAGRTLIEVMGAGVPAVVHRHCTTRLIGGLDGAYDGVPTWREERELQAIVGSVDAAFLHAQSRLARAWYERYHRDAVVAAALADPDHAPEVPALKPGWTPDPLLQALQALREATFASLLKRRVYRLLRTAKAWWGRR